MNYDDATVTVTELDRQLDAIQKHPELANFAQREVRANLPLREGQVSDPEKHGDAERLRYSYFLLAATLTDTLEPGRHRSLALTELETSMMYAIKALYA
jgi:hypothetical protein